MKRWLVFDTETTGLLIPEAPLDKQPRIIELAVIELTVVPDSSIPPYLIREQAWLISPGEPLTDEITKITGLTDDDLRGKPSFAEVLPELITWFLGAHGLVAHNLPFDRTMLINELRRMNMEYNFPYPPEQICTVAAFTHIFGRRMKLVELYHRAMGKELHQTHRALDDTRALAQIVIKEGVVS